MTELVVLSGSGRSGSFNTLLAARLAAIAEQAGAGASMVHLGDLDIPIYDGDFEAANGLPQAVKTLKDQLASGAGMIVACPEYNGFMTPLLINTIDWCTRSEQGSPDLSAFTDKTAFIASASPGPGGGGRAATHLRTMLAGIGCIVHPQSLSVPSAHGAFDDQGGFKDDAMTDRAERMVKKFVLLAEKLSVS